VKVCCCSRTRWSEPHSNAIHRSGQNPSADLRHATAIEAVACRRQSGLPHITGQVSAGPAELGLGNNRKPSTCSLAVGCDLDLGRLDRLDAAPIVGEARLNLGLADSPRSPITGLLAAEAEHEIAPVRFDSCTKAPHKAFPVTVIEYVKQAAVQDCVVPIATRFELQRVGHEESGIKVSISGFLLSRRDGLR
jgi:hypothetical protein